MIAKRVVLLRSNPVRPYPRLEKMANYLSKNGFDVTVLAWDRDADYPPKEEVLKLKDTSVRIIRIGIRGQFSGGIRKNFKGLLKFQKFIYSWLKAHRADYDIIHSYDFDTGYTALKCAKKLKKKLIYDIPDYYVDSHGLNGSLIGWIIKRMENRVINKSDATIICTEERKKQISGTHPKNLYVIHNTPDITVEAIKSCALEDEPLKLVYVGIFGRARFIDKIAETVAKRNDCEFHIGGYGAGMESYFEDMAKKHNNIFYYGRIPYEKTIQLECDCDVMCAIYDPKVPNHYYAAPNKFYEALALGKPLLMAKNTGMASIVEEYGIGEVIDYDEISLNSALDRLIANKSKFKQIADIEIKMYNEKYSWTRMENTIDKIYSDIGDELK